MSGQILDGSLGAFLGLHSKQVNPSVSIPDANGAILGAAEKMSGMVDAGVGVMEVQTRDCAFVLVERAHVFLRVQVEDADGVVGSARGHHGATDGDAFDGPVVRGIRELPYQLLLLGLHVVAPQEALV